MRTIRECIKDSCNLHGVTTGLALAGFIQVMAMILVYDAHQRLTSTVPTVTIDGEVIDGEAIESPSLVDYIALLNSNDVMRSWEQLRQLSGFMAWLLDQEEPEDDLWFLAKGIVEKWNEYAEIEKGKRNG